MYKESTKQGKNECHYICKQELTLHSSTTGIVLRGGEVDSSYKNKSAMLYLFYCQVLFGWFHVKEKSN